MVKSDSFFKSLCVIRTAKEALAELRKHVAVFEPPATATEIANGKSRLSMPFPTELKDLYLETNGFPL